MGSKRVSDIVYFKHKHITNPTVTPEDAVVQAAQQITAALKENLKTAID